jgi:hypothetical protein
MPEFTKAILPKKLRVQAMATEIINAAVKDAKAMKKDFDKTTKTWQGEKPFFNSEVFLDPPNAPAMGSFPQRIVTRVWSLDDGSKGYWKWRWLDEGTKVRYAIMTPKFIPKTRTGQLNSWKGKGGLLIVNKKKPMPGIKPRKFGKALTKKWKSPHVANLRTAMNKAAQASGHAVK